MPIQPQYRWFYPIDWPQLSEVIRFRRAKGRCEGCGRPHGKAVCHLGDGRWWDSETGVWRDGRGRKCRGLSGAPVALVLTEHLDGDGPTVFEHACRLGLEGIVSKRRSARYRSGRDPNWLKIKCPEYQRP